MALSVPVFFLVALTFCPAAQAYPIDRDFIVDGPSVVVTDTIPIAVMTRNMPPYILEEILIYEDINQNGKVDQNELILKDNFAPITNPYTPLKVDGTQNWWYKIYRIKISDLPSKKTFGETKIALKFFYGEPVNWNDKASSLKIKGSVTLYEHINYGGTSITFANDEPNLVNLGWNDKASSLRVGGSVTLYEHMSYEGASVTFTNDESNLVNVFFIPTEKLEVKNGYFFTQITSRPTMDGWYAGDMHTHSWYTYADWIVGGEFGPPPETMAEIARACGLDFVVLTDHTDYWLNEGGYSDMIWETDLMTSIGFPMLPGEEVMCAWAGWKIVGHAPELLCLAPEWFISRSPYDAQSILGRTHQAGGLVFVAHPITGGWDFGNMHGYEGLEVWNGDWDDGDEWALKKWDELLQAEKDPADGFWVGIGNSDAHDLRSLGITRTYVYLPGELSEVEIKKALREGHCVFSNGPLTVFELQNCGRTTEIGELAIVPQNTTLNFYFDWTEGVDRIELYKDGDLLTTSTGAVTSPRIYDSVGSLHYFRCVGRSTDGHFKCFTNPIWVKVDSPDAEPPAVSITSCPSPYVARQSVTVEWVADDLYTGVEHYEVYLNDTLQGAPDTNSWTFDDLADGNYAAKIVAYDYAGNSGSRSMTFKVDATPPPVPVLKSVPINDNTPTFGWSSVSDPSGVTYTLQIARDLDFNPLQLTRTDLTTNTYAVTSNEALPSGTWYWRIKATDGAGNVSWSKIESFEVSTPINWWLWGGIITVLVAVIGVVAMLYIRGTKHKSKRGM